MLLSHLAYEGITIIVNSVFGATQYLLQSGMPFVLTEKFSQDVLEEYFGRHTAMLKEGGKGDSCSSCPFPRESKGARSTLLNSIHYFQQSIRTEPKLSWNGNLNGQKGSFPLEIVPRQHFVNFRLVDCQLVSVWVFKACLLSHYFNKTQILFIFCNFTGCILCSSALKSISAPLCPSMLPASLKTSSSGMQK